MDDYTKPITFGLGVVIGIAASSLTLLALQRDFDDEEKSVVSHSSVKESKATQTTPLIEPKVTMRFNTCLISTYYFFILVGPGTCTRQNAF